MKLSVLITGLLLLLLANMMMVYYAPYGMIRREGFQAATEAPVANAVQMENVAAEVNANKGMMNTGTMGAEEAGASNTNVPVSTAAPAVVSQDSNVQQQTTEGFASYFLSNAAGSKDSYTAMGPFDGVKLKTGNSVSEWRYTAPNESLMGPAFEPGPDSLFMFKSNQCKPECCGASFSCGGGCVCTTPDQRQYLASRGGNRTRPEDSA